MPATQSCQQRNFCHGLFPSQLQPPVAVLGVPGVLCWTSTAMEKLQLPPTFLQNSRRINVMEQVEEQRPQNNTLGSFTFRMVSESCAQQVPNKSTNVVFIIFWIQKGTGEKELQMEKKAGTREGSTASSWEGHSNVGSRVPVTTTSSQSSAHPNCCISC